MQLEVLEQLLGSILRWIAEAGNQTFDQITLRAADSEGLRAASEHLQLDPALTVDFALDGLAHARLVVQIPQGGFQLTGDGSTALSTNDVLTFLEHSEEFAEWLELQQLSLALQNAPTVAARDFTGFERLQIRSWRQFGDIDIAFHSRLTILTGANGAGKTTLLNILGRHFDWPQQLLAMKRSAIYTDSPVNELGRVEIGKLQYRWGWESPLMVNYAGTTPVYEAVVENQRPVPGLYISSHRSMSAYQPVTDIPSAFSTTEVLLQQFAGEVRSRHFGGTTGRSPFWYMKQALIAAAIFGEGNRAVRKNDQAEQVWEGFQSALRHMLPNSLGFQRLSVDSPDIVIETVNGPFLLESLSGGLSAIFELAWQIFLRSRDYPTFTVCIDEPENHLHPELQRSLLPSILEAFPRISFIVSTHSPMVVTSVPDGNVYSLLYGDGGKVESSLVPLESRSGTPDFVLSRVLGLDSSLPIWAQEEVRLAVRSLPSSPSARDLNELRYRLSALGLNDQFPAALAALSSQDSDETD